MRGAGAEAPRIGRHSTRRVGSGPATPGRSPPTSEGARVLGWGDRGFQGGWLGARRQGGARREGAPGVMGGSFFHNQPGNLTPPGSGGVLASPPGGYKPQPSGFRMLHPISANRPGEPCPPNSGGSLGSLFLPWDPRSLPQSQLRLGFRMCVWGGVRPQSSGAWGPGGKGRPSWPGPLLQPVPRGCVCQDEALPGHWQPARPVQGPCRWETEVGVCSVLGPALCPAGRAGGGEGPPGGRICRDRASPDYRWALARPALPRWEEPAQGRGWSRVPTQTSFGDKHPPDPSRPGEIPSPRKGPCH